MSDFSITQSGVTIKKVGEVITITGMGGLFLMAVAGTVICDVMIFIAIMKEGERRNRNNNDNQFVTGFLLGTMMSRNRPMHHDAGVMLAASPILTGIAIGLAFNYGYSAVAFGLIFGWSGAAGVVLLGLALYALGTYLERLQNDNPGLQVSVDLEQGLSSATNPTYITRPSAPQELPRASVVTPFNFHSHSNVPVVAAVPVSGSTNVYSSPYVK